MSKPFISVVEVGPRDGLQNEAAALSTSAKIEFITRAVDAGVRRIEAVSFVNPKKVPQMADAEAIMAAVPRDRGVSYSGLVLNHRGFDRAVAAGCDEICFVVASTDSFGLRNQGMKCNEAIAAWHDIAAEAADRRIGASVTISNAFGCPFDGPVPAARVREIATDLLRSPAAELVVADTIGVAVPPQITSVIKELAPIAGKAALRMHFHNTRNMAVANVHAAIMAGVSVIDTSIGGIGGCPFAPKATGNVATEDVLYLLEGMGIETGLQLDRLIATAKWLEQQLGRKVPGMVAQAGGFPRSQPASMAVA